jgi:ribosomal protein L23
LKKSETFPESNERSFYIGSDESEIEIKQKIELIQAFIVATKGIQEITTQWTQNRAQFGLTKNLKKKYTRIA